MKFPMLPYFDNIIKSAIKSVYDGINEGTEKYRKSFDLLRTFRKTHFTRLDKELSKVQILSMTGPVKLTDLYVPTKLTSRVARQYFITLDRNQNLTAVDLHAAREVVDIFKAFSENKCIILLGGPGSGKTTFLSAFVLGHAGLCDKVSDVLVERYLPVYIAIRDVEEPPQDLRDTISNAIIVEGNEDAWPFLERMLAKGLLLLVLDGLDEIPTKQHSDWRKAILKLIKIYPDIRIVLSCRTGGLTVDLPDFHHFEILPFDHEDISQFVSAWFGSVHADLARKLLEVLTSNPSVAELSRTPLLLALVCILFENDLELPVHKTELYNRAIDTMLVRWDASRGFRRASQFPELTTAKRRRLFQYLAATMTRGNSSLVSEEVAKVAVAHYISKFGLEQDSSGEVLDELESHHGILVTPAANVRTFSHLSLQDYFTAEYLKETRQELIYLSTNFSRKRSRDIIVFLASMLEDSGHMVEKMIDLSDVQQRQYYPALAKRLAASNLIIRTLAEGAALHPELRTKAQISAIDSLTYVSRHLQETGLNLYFSFVRGEPKLRHTFFKERSSTDLALLAIEELVSAIAFSNYATIITYIRNLLEAKSLAFSTRAILSACLFAEDPEAVLKNYQKILEVRSIPKRYRSLIERTVNELEVALGREDFTRK